MKKSLEKILIPLVAVLLAFGAGSILILIVGKNPLVAYAHLFKGAFGSMSSVGETLLKATPLIFTGLAAVFSYRCGMFNLGAEGQFIMGACAAVWFTLGPAAALPSTFDLILTLILGTLAGAVWGAIPGLLKALCNLNEMIVSILLNYIATLFLSFLFCGPLMEATIPQTAAVAEAVHLTRFLPGTRVHTGVFIAFVTALLMYYFFYRTYKGYQFRAVGLNPVASRGNGFPVRPFMIGAFIVSGAIAGLGGAASHGRKTIPSGLTKGFPNE